MYNNRKGAPEHGNRVPSSTRMRRPLSYRRRAVARFYTSHVCGWAFPSSLTPSSMLAHRFTTRIRFPGLSSSSRSISSTPTLTLSIVRGRVRAAYNEVGVGPGAVVQRRRGGERQYQFKGISGAYERRNLIVRAECPYYSKARSPGSPQ